MFLVFSTQWEKTTTNEIMKNSPSPLISSRVIVKITCDSNTMIKIIDIILRTFALCSSENIPSFLRGFLTILFTLFLYLGPF